MRVDQTDDHYQPVPLQLSWQAWCFARLPTGKQNFWTHRPWHFLNFFRVSRLLLGEGGGGGGEGDGRGGGGGGGEGGVTGNRGKLVGGFPLLGFLVEVVFCAGTAGIGLRLCVEVDGNKKFWLLLESRDFCDL